MLKRNNVQIEGRDCLPVNGNGISKGAAARKMSYMFGDVQGVHGVAGNLPALHIKGIGWPDGAENRNADQERLKDRVHAVVFGVHPKSKMASPSEPMLSLGHKTTAGPLWPHVGPSVA